MDRKSTMAVIHLSIFLVMISGCTTARLAPPIANSTPAKLKTVKIDPLTGKLFRELGLLENTQTDTIDLLKKPNAKQIRNLLSRGAKLEGRTPAVGYTPLLLAVQGSQLEAVDLLLRSGANVNAQMPVGDKRTALIIAAEEGDAAIVRRLLQHGANVNTQDRVGVTALFQAVDNKKLEIVRVLLKSGADPNIVDIANDTPLAIAERRNPQEVAIIQLLRDSMRSNLNGR